MGKRGPQPKPTSAKRLAGNPGKRRLNAREPKSPAGAPAKPAGLSTRAASAWKALSPVLTKMGVLTKIDAIALEALCSCYAQWREARAVIEKDGTTFTVETREQQTVHRVRPEVAIAVDAEKRLRQWLKEFGLTPSARSGLGGGEAADPLEAFLEKS